MENGYRQYNYIINRVTGERVQANDFYFYPLTIADYAKAYSDIRFERYPLMAFIYLTNHCNDDCGGCFAKTIEDEEAQLPWPVVDNLLRDLSQHGTKAIKLAGREPTAYPDLHKCLALSHELGLKSLVITSGTNIDRHAESISKHCTHLRISLNTVSQEKHDKLHRPKANALKFNQRLDYIRDIVSQRRKSRLVSGATFLLRNTTLDDAYEFAFMCRDIGFNYVRFSMADDESSLLELDKTLYYRLLSVTTSHYEVIFHSDINDTLADNCDHNLIDPAIRTRTTIHANGKVNSCQGGWRNKWPTLNFATFGNINDSSFYDIWTGDKRKKFVDFVESTQAEGSKNVYHNCKYKSFNTIHRWLMQQVKTNDCHDMIPLLVPEKWS